MQDLDVVPVAVPSRESLDATGDIRPVPAGDVDMGAVRPLAEDKSSPWGIRVGVYLTLSKQSLVHGLGSAVPAVLGLRHVKGEGHEGFTSVRSEPVCPECTLGSGDGGFGSGDRR